jgi:hypothetical protein
MRQRIRFIAPILALFLLASLSSSGGSANQAGQGPAGDSQNRAQTKERVVYVCACLKTKSCSCMTESKMQGPCACGTEGGPPMKAVPPDSRWAKENRKALAE